MWEATSSFRIRRPGKGPGSEAFVPLIGVRKALCVHIVHTFLDRELPAYTLWVYDVETGKEWYAPIRYYQDFVDLRAATIRLCPSISKFPFPKQSRSLFGSPIRESEKDLEIKRRLLDQFLRSLLIMVYREPFHPSMAEIAIHAQTFLGNDSDAYFSEDEVTRRIVNPIDFMEKESAGGADNEGSSRVRLFLKRSIQLYTYRLFLLEAMRATVDQFVAHVQDSGPSLKEIEALEAQSHEILKNRVMEELGRIQAFLNQMHDTIVNGCMDDFRSIAGREDYEGIHEMISGKKGEAYWERLVHEAVREQIEIEVYVPLRSAISRWLVSGWKHEDMEAGFKIKELRKRPQTFFRITEDKMSPSNWSSASAILRDGVGLCTLPSVKLRAIVEAGREISKLFASEHDVSEHGIQSEHSRLGADNFLPVFIYCVVQAEIERPCALSVLLRTLCDRFNQIGEVGYHLASFEAAIAHIQEIDLTAELPDQDKVSSSLLSISLNDSS